VELFEQRLGHIQGGRVLDLATGEGGFSELLADRLAGYSQILGVDITPQMSTSPYKDTSEDRIHLIQMDAGCLGFADETFDTLGISASLHHLANPKRVFLEIERMLRPGGHLAIAEMHRDASTEAQMTSISLHIWAASVDLALGLPHYPTLTRQQILNLVDALDLHNIALWDWDDSESDPLDRGRIASLEGVLERYLSKAQGVPDQLGIAAQAEMLRRRLHEVGAQSEPRIAIVGQKPW
jgi:SAM-dependent methyltransferase